MAAGNKYQIILDFLVNMKADKSQVSKLAAEFEALAKDINPEITVNSDKAKKGISEIIDNMQKMEQASDDLNAILDELDVELNTEEARQQLDALEEAINALDDVQFKALQDAIDGIEFTSMEDMATNVMKVLSGLNTDSSISEFKKLSDEFSRAGAAAKQLYSEQAQALAQMKLNGQEGTDAYVALEADLKKTRSELDRFANAASEIDNIFDDTGAGEAVNDVKKLADEFAQAEAEAQSLLDTQKKALAAMKMSGQEGSQAYQDLEEEIGKTQSKVEEFAQASGKIGESVKADSFTDIMFKFQSIGQLGDTLGSFSEGGAEVTNSLREIAAKTGATTEEMEKLKSSAYDVFKSGVGESVGEVVKTLGNAKQVLGQFLDQKGIEDFTKSAAGIGKVFDKDINEVINGSRTFIAQFGLEGKKAGELVAYAMQQTGSKSEDTLDTLDEYSVLVKRAGYSAEEFVGVLTTGMKAGARDTDKLGDSIKEMNLRIMEGDAATELADVVSQFGDKMPSALEKTISSLLAAGKAGTKSTKEVASGSAKAIAEAYDAGQISDVLRDKLARTLSGTMAEDMGGAMWTKVFSAPIDTASIVRKAKAASDAMNKAIEPISFGDKLQRELDGIKTSIAEKIGPVTKEIQGVLKEASTMAPAIIALKDVGGLMGDIGGGFKTAGTQALAFGKSILSTLLPSFATAGTAGTTAFTSVAVAETAAGEAGVASGTATATAWGAALAPFLAVAAGVAGLVIGLKLLSDALNETAQEKMDDAKANEEMLKSQMDTVQAQKDVVETNLSLVDAFKSQGKAAMDNVDLMYQLAEAYPGVIDGSKSYEQNLAALEQASQGSTKELGNLNTQMDDLTKKMLETKRMEISLDVQVKKEDMENQLTDTFNKFSWDKVGKGAAKGATLGFAGAITGAFTGAFGGKIGEWFNLGSTGRDQAKKLMSDFKSGITNAKSVQDIQRAGYDLVSKIYADKTLSPQEQKAAVEKAKAFTEATVKEFTANQDKLKVDVSTMIDLGKSDAEITDQLSKQYGKTKEEIAAMIKKQRESKAVTKDQEKAAESLGSAWSAAAKKAQDAANTQVTEVAGMVSKRNELLKKDRAQWTADEKKFMDEYQKNYSDAVQKGRAAARTMKSNAKLQENIEVLIGLKEGPDSLEPILKIADIRKQMFEYQQKEYELAHEAVILSENREKGVADEVILQKSKVDSIKAEKQALIDLLVAKKRIKLNDNGGIVLVADKKEHMNTIRQRLQDINNEVRTEENNLKSIMLKVDVNKDELEKQLKDLSNQRITWEIEVGLRNVDDYRLIIQQYDANYADLKAKLTKSNEELAKIEAKTANEMNQALGKATYKEIEDISKSYEQKTATYIAETEKLTLKKQELERESVTKVTEAKSKKAQKAISDDYKAQIQAVEDAIAQVSDSIADIEAERDKKIREQTNNSTLSQIRDLRIKHSEVLNITREKNQQLQQQTLDAQQKRLSIEKTFYDASIAKLTEYYDKRKAVLADKLTQEEELHKRIADVALASSIVVLDEQQAARSKKIDKGLEDEQKKLDKYKELGMITDEMYEDKKLRLEDQAQKKRDKLAEEYRKKKLIEDTKRAAIDRIAQNQRNTAELELEQQKEQQLLDIYKNTHANTVDEETGFVKFDSEADQKAYDAMAKSLEDRKKLIDENTSNYAQSLKAGGLAIADGLTNLFAGDTKGARDSIRKGFAEISQIWISEIEKLLDAAILKQFINWFGEVDGMPWLVKFALIPGAYAMVSGAIHGIADPIISKIGTSLATGGVTSGLIVDSPTLFSNGTIVGDGARLGAPNREYIFTDPGYVESVQRAITAYNRSNSNVMYEIRDLLASQQLSAVLRGQDLVVSLNRASYAANSRAR